MTTIHIPPAALEAGARAICLRDGFNPDDEIYTLVPASHPMQKLVRRWTLYVDTIRAAFEAMVQAWEGAKRVKGYFTHDTDYYEPAFILPLPQETRDDE